MQRPVSENDVLPVSRLAEVLGGIQPLASSARSNLDCLLVEIYSIPSLGPTPKFCYEDRHVVAIQRRGTVTIREPSLKILHRGSIGVRPAGIPQSSLTFLNARVTLVLLNPAFVRQALGDAVNENTLEIASRVGARDEQLNHLVRAAEIEVESGLPSGRLYLESLGTALAAHLWTHHATKVVTLKQSGNTMPQHLLRRTIDFIRENLGKDVSLGKLSADVRMSKYHFCHLFKASTGLSPHQYVKRERLKRARQLLVEHRLSLVEIANELGFSDQSHFSRSFHTVMGMTPSQYAARA